jgi:hypothetical protein
MGVLRNAGLNLTTSAAMHCSAFQGECLAAEAVLL